VKGGSPVYFAVMPMRISSARMSSMRISDEFLIRSRVQNIGISLGILLEI
jgi:hypothetical protein